MLISVRRKNALLLAAVFAGHIITAVPQKSNESKPNFVILFADDVSSFMHKYYTDKSLCRSKQGN